MMLQSSPQLRNISRVVICRGQKGGRRSRHASFKTFLALTRVPLPSPGGSRGGHRTGAPHSPSASASRFERHWDPHFREPESSQAWPPGAPPLLSSGQRPSCAHGPCMDTASGAEPTHFPDAEETTLMAQGCQETVQDARWMEFQPTNRYRAGVPEPQARDGTHCTGKVLIADLEFQGHWHPAPACTHHT